MKTIAIYARYSSDNQRDESIEDQVRLCREKAEKEGWKIYNVYSDHAISGASLMRPGIQQLIQDSMAGKFELILTEALDRLSRDQEDMAGFYKRAEFAGIGIHTLSEGKITSLHIGFKGTMNAMFLKDLKDKVKRGQRGRVENGKLGGGNCFGYDVVKKLDAHGELIRGERNINEVHAQIIRRIFSEYADGKSPRAIATGLNADGAVSPTGKGWSSSTINGNWQRGSGILNNEQYVGQIVWNKVSYPNDPDTGKHVSRINPPEEWIRKEVPHLRIIDQKLWDDVKGKQKKRRIGKDKFWKNQRPKHLFSFLLKCGECGGGLSKTGQRHYGCSTARNKGPAMCANRRTIRQDILENTVLGALQSKLMNPDLVDEFSREYTAHINRLRIEHNASLDAYKTELEKLGQQEKKIVQAVMDGFASEPLKIELDVVVARKKELSNLITKTPEAPVLLHPSMAVRYRTEVNDLVKTLNDEKRRHEAVELIRGLIDKVVVTPDSNSDGVTIDLFGDLAGILRTAIGDKPGKNQQEIDFKQIKMVVGLDNLPFNPKQGKLVGPAGLEPATRPL